MSREEFLNAGDFQSAVAKARTLGFGLETLGGGVAVGAFALSSERAAEYFEKAQIVRRLISNDFDRVFRGPDAVDVLLAPTSASTGDEIEDVGGVESGADVCRRRHDDALRSRARRRCRYPSGDRASPGYP